MDNKQYLDIIFMGLLTILTVVFIEMPVFIIHNILGFILVTFIPGYCLLSALFPGKNKLGGVERASLSIALSLIVAALTVLALKYTSGVSWTSTLLALSGISMVLVVLAFLRRWETDEKDIFYPKFSIKPFSDYLKGRSSEYKTLMVVTAAVLVIVVSATVYVALVPQDEEGFTEFYITGPQAMAADYPSNLTVGENGNVTLGIVNHEHGSVNYEVVVKSNNRTLDQWNVTVAKGAKLEIPYQFTGTSAGKKEIKFLLYKLPDEEKVYRSLYLNVGFE